MPSLSPLKYKNFVWPHNPSFYGIKFVKDIIQHRYLDINGAELEDLGMDARVFSGSGVFFGEGAYQEFGKLATVFYDKGPGKLIHPIWMPVDAVFTRLELKQEPTPDYVEYEFEFIEDKRISVIEEVVYKGSGTSSSGGSGSGSSSSAPNSTNQVVHTVKQGETLSGIGSLYGVNWRDIADDNKKLIKDPNVIQIGWKLTINNPKKSPNKSSSSSSSSNNQSIQGRAGGIQDPDNPRTKPSI